jgi:hypothetical protein
MISSNPHRTHLSIALSLSFEVFSAESLWARLI